ncbi:MAG: hypothetical protein WC299_06195 [Kiritimatiellia bacterium]
MNEQELHKRAALIYAVRVRKVLNIQRNNSIEELKAGIKPLLPTKFWKYLGYERLYDFLVDELGMPYDPAGDLVMEAIKLNIEAEELYGQSNTDNNGQQNSWRTGQTTRSKPDVASAGSSAG